jgi:hypothetical protein
VNRSDTAVAAGIVKRERADKTLAAAAAGALTTEVTQPLGTGRGLGGGCRAPGAVFWGRFLGPEMYCPPGSVLQRCYCCSDVQNSTDVATAAIMLGTKLMAADGMQGC